MTQYEHFERWAKEFQDQMSNTTVLELHELVNIYLSTYPGRTDRLVTELVSLAREWDATSEKIYDEES